MTFWSNTWRGDRYYPETDSFFPPKVPSKPRDLRPNYCVLQVVGSSFWREALELLDSDYSLPWALRIADIRNWLDRSRSFLVAPTTGWVITSNHIWKLAIQLGLEKNVRLRVLRTADSVYKLVRMDNQS